MTSQRVLSGSRTKGSTATITGSVQYFHQGTSVRTFSSYVGSTLPRIGSADRTEVYKDGSPLSRLNQFDDSVIINNNLADMGGESDGGRIEERVNHAYEERVFGQAPSTLMGEPFADTSDFDPVSYIKDPGDVMWPVNMWNAGSLDKHEFDGVVEPLDIRREIFGEIDTRYEGRAVRGALVGAASERPWGSKELQNKWYIYDRQDHPFLDAPMSYNLMSNDKPAVVNYSSFTWDLQPAGGGPFYSSTFRLVGNATSQTFNILNNKLWMDLSTVNVTDLSRESAPLENTGFVKADDVTIGSVTYPALEFGAGTPDATTSNISLTPNWPLPPLTDVWYNRFLAEENADISTRYYELTLSCWVKINVDSVNSNGTPTRSFPLWSFGIDTFNSAGANIRVDYYRPTYNIHVQPGDFPPSRPNSDNTDGVIQVRIRDESHKNGGFSTDYIMTEDWNLLHDGELHNVVVTARIPSWTGNAYSTFPSDEERATQVSVYVDGVQVNTGYQILNGNTNDEYSSDYYARIDETAYGTRSYFGAHYTSTSINRPTLDATFAIPAVWNRVLTSSEIEMLYSITRGDTAVELQTFASESYNIEYGPSLGRLPLQAYQNIEQSSDPAFLEKDTYHDRVYFSLLAHNNSDMRVALQNLNSSSCESLTDPFEKRAASGLTTGQSVGSIAFSDTFIIGDKNEGQ